MRPELPPLPVGRTYTLQHQVTDADTARHYGSGALEDLLATPTLVSLMIKACVDLVDPELSEELISIGKRMEIEHVQPTPKGMTVNIAATLAGTEGNRLVFDLEVVDELGTVANGRHERFVVSRSGIRAKAEERAKALESLD